MGSIRVERKGYSFRNKFGTLVRVSPTSFLIKDRGAKGRGKKVFNVEKGKMSQWAIKLGYMSKGQRISDIPIEKMDNFARDLADHIGERQAMGMFRSQLILRKRQRASPFTARMRKALSALGENYP